MQFRKVCGILGTLAFFLAASVDVNGATPADKSPGSIATPKSSPLAVEFVAKGLKLGSPVFLRVYKQSSKMELWVAQGARYALFKTYRICRWSGGLGPKMYEGDRQSPEGLYHITSEDLIVNPRWHRAMNINFPNRFDIINGRGGSGILIHGKCASVGCFAIEDNNVEEVFDAVRAALRNGQVSVPVLALPFNFAKYAPAIDDTLRLNEFWTDLRRADILFNRDHIPPSAWVCDGRYYFADRRGDSHRHAVHLPGCKPLEKPITQEEAASLSERSQSVLAASTARNKWLVSGGGAADTSFIPAVSVPGGNPRQAVVSFAAACNPRLLQCRLLREALKSPAMCPTKYPRCRTAQAAYTKSVECPLKYPRCRFFVGRDPHMASRSNTLKVKQR